MTTIVKHRRTGNQYILLGINGEENKTNPSRFINELFNSSQAKEEVSYSATVCDVQGNLFLAYIDDLVVVEIDGEKPSDILPEPEYESPKNYYSQDEVDDFDDEELEEDDFDDNENEDDQSDQRVIVTPQPKSYTDGENLSDNSDFADEEDEEDEDWI